MQLPLSFAYIFITLQDKYRLEHLFYFKIISDVHGNHENTMKLEISFITYNYKVIHGHISVKNLKEIRINDKIRGFLMLSVHLEKLCFLFALLAIWYYQSSESNSFGENNFARVLIGQGGRVQNKPFSIYIVNFSIILKYLVIFKRIKFESI